MGFACPAKLQLDRLDFIRADAGLAYSGSVVATNDLREQVSAKLAASSLHPHVHDPLEPGMQG